MDENTVAAALTDAARDFHDQESVQAMLDRVVHHAAELVAGCEHVGIARVRRHSVQTLAASDDLVRRLDRAQQTYGEGPCWEVTRQRVEAMTVSDLNAETDRWPRFTPAARRLGIESMTTFLLCDDRTALGTLTVYCSKTGSFTRSARQVGLVLASHASVAFTCARAEADLQTALVTRAAIGEAIGIAIERHKVTPIEAFALLSKIAQDRHVELVDIARQVTWTGRFPPS